MCGMRKESEYSENKVKKLRKQENFFFNVKSDRKTRDKKREGRIDGKKQ